MQGNIPQVKVVILGESGVGKSSVMLRFVTNNFKLDSASTVGASYMGKVLQISDKTIKFNIWDTAGQERYHSLARMYLHDATAAILLYDITNKSSFEALKRWHTELKDAAPASIVLGICGNKEDLVMNEVVSPDEAKEFAKHIGGFFRKTSAKTSQGIESVFKEIAARVFEGVGANNPSTGGSIALERRNSKTAPKKKCC
jgi:small GTP-binding protein